MLQQINAADLRSILKTLAPVALKSSADFGTVLIDTQEGAAYSRDAELSIKVLSGALRYTKPDTAGQVFVNAKKLAAVVSSLSGAVELSTPTEKILRLKAGRSKFELPVFDPATAQVRMEKTEGVGHSLLLKDFQSLLAFPLEAADTHNNAYAAVKVSVEGESLSASGTDGHRLTLSHRPVEAISGLDVLIPTRAVRAVRELDGERICIAEDETTIYFSTGDAGARIAAKKLVEKFPDHRKYIPTETKAEIKIHEAKEALDALRHVGTCLDDDNRVELHFEEGAVLFKTAGEGKAEESVPSDTLLPDPVFDEPVEFKVALDHRFLTDFFQHATGPVRIAGNSDAEPVLFKSGNLQMLVAPIRW